MACNSSAGPRVNYSRDEICGKPADADSVQVFRLFAERKPLLNANYGAQTDHNAAERGDLTKSLRDS
jgi:hypothetical protein